MRWQTLSLLFVVLLSSSGDASAETVQEAGLPNPAILEIVFPQIKFGQRSVKFATEIVIENSTQHEACVRLELFDQQGQVPSLSWDGRDGTHVPPGYILSLELPPGPRKTGELLDPLFIGWGILRSNQKITAYQRIKVLDPGTNGLISETQFFGVASPIQRAEIPVLLPDSDQGTEIAIVNVSDSEKLAVEVQYWEGRSNPLLDSPPGPVETFQLELPPRSQQQFEVPNYSTVWSIGFVRVIAAAGQSFALTALSVRLDDQSRPRFFPPGPYDWPGDNQIHITSSEAWGLDVPIYETEHLRDLEIILADFGFFLRYESKPNVFYRRGKQEGSWGSHTGISIEGPFPLCGFWNPGRRPLVSEEAGIAIIGRSREKPIIFGDSRKVIRAVLLGTIQHILNLPDQNAVEVASGWTNGWSYIDSYILIDKEQEEVIDRFIDPTGGAPPIVPPWR